ncbi:MAG: hypothetical protein LPL00_12570 [Alphaproteobacteria bacterium]|nr:hypothetical protein [Alphaproteobacteria bacterium]MDX5370644.1 hypothetical protein [Alphaproteobacteria bacterium]MDX5465081.1 hypothetical protein [Alphaproteobacteria bacterium]
MQSSVSKYARLLGSVAVGAIAAGALTAVLATGTAGTASADNHGGKGGQGGQSGQMGAGKGGKGDARGHGARGKSLMDVLAEEDEDSDRPSWAGVPGRDGKPGRGNPSSGGKKGDLFGDMYVLLRDDNGVPILVVWSDTNNDGVPDSYVESADGFVQPIDAEGNPIPLDEEGAIYTGFEEDAQEVELGRLNVGRSPVYVLATRYEEAINTLNDPNVASLSLDPTGRILITYTDGTSKTIDAPLENLALYLEIMSTGTLTGVTSTSLFTGDLANLVDGSLTTADLVDAASFFAAASDKFGTVGEDTIIYMNQILGLATYVGDDYIDYKSFTYDRETTWGDVEVTLMLPGTTEGTWVETDVNIWEDFFKEADASGSNVDGFATATNDLVQVIEYIHEYAVPVTPTE